MLFTSKGDDGTTNMFSCDQQRISKASELPEALGVLDELNTFLGFVKVKAATNARIVSALHEVQQTLFIIQAEVAGADKMLKNGTTKQIENTVNQIEKEIAPVKNFCIAGGTELSALLDVARTISRRAERRIVAVQEAGLRNLASETMAYMNRLSSLLFVLARLANYEAGIAEESPKY